MVKLVFNLLVILFMLTFVMGCTSTKSSQTSGESPKISTESQKKPEEWIKAEVTNGHHKYSYKVPGGSEIASQDFFDELSREFSEEGDPKFNSGFFLDKDTESKFKTPWVAAAILNDDNEVFKNYSSMVNNNKSLQAEGTVVCKNDKELVDAIQKQPSLTVIISKDKKAVFYKFVDKLENEEYVSLTSLYIDKKSAVYFSFLEKKEQFGKQLPTFLKIVDTVTLVK